MGPGHEMGIRDTALNRQGEKAFVQVLLSIIATACSNVQVHALKPARRGQARGAPFAQGLERKRRQTSPLFEASHVTVAQVLGAEPPAS